jgi:MFS family permease
MPAARAFTEVLDEARWGREHWKLFAVVSINYVLDGVMFSIAPLLAYIVAPEKFHYIFAANLLAETLGALAFGRLADVFGRRVMFAIALAIEAASLLLLIPLYENLAALVILTSAMTFGIGGEFGAAYAAIAELVPARHRGKALMISTNFWNIGAAVIAGLMLVYTAIAEDPATQARYLLMSALGTAIVAGVARIGMPESPRWLVARGRRVEAEALVRRIAGYSGELSFELPPSQLVGLGEALSRHWVRLLVLAVVTVAQYVTYDVTAYYLPYSPGYRFGLESVPYVVFVANLGASVGAFLLLPLIDRTRRASILASFAGGFLTALAIYAAHAASGLELFYAAVFANLVFSEWAWASLSVLQSELFPTGVRASVIGLLTSLTGVSGAAVVFLEARMTFGGFFAVVLGLWAAGALASAYWYLKGIESARKSVEELA